VRTAVISVIALLLLLCSTAVGVDPPVKLWEKWYYTSYDGCFFRDIELTDSGNLFITGGTWDWTEPIQENYCAFLFDQDGNVLWKVVNPFYGFAAYDGTILPDDSYIITGTSVVTSSDTYSLFIMKIDQNGSIEWTKVYDYPDTKEEGYGITCLPDGGFAVCGRVHGTGIHGGQAWLLRTDEYGDTLWTKTWESSFSWGKAVLFNNNELCVLANGATDSLPTRGPHLLFYDLNGNYLRGTDYPTLHDLEPASICTASDGGYTFTTGWWPPVWHTDRYGETLWWKSIYITPGDEHQGYCIRQTMDSGYIFSGWDGYYEYEPDGDRTDNQEGWLARFDSEGNELWNINNSIGSNNHYYSVVQLPEGGYIACGSYGAMEFPDSQSRGVSGYLVRYAPETGIEETEPAPAGEMSISPNPFNSTLSVSFTLQEAMNVSLTVYDLSGRMVDTVTTGFFPAGNNTANWTVPEGLSSGCYLLRLDSSNWSKITNCILLN
jgi:hypothetical protein